jgi:hypothetical protein
MRRGLLLFAIAIAAALILWAQQRDRPVAPRYEVKLVLPRETSPAQYKQVDERELQSLAEQGWQLVGVVPYIYKNEERGTPDLAPRPMVTQTYPAYFLQRLRPAR